MSSTMLDDARVRGGLKDRRSHGGTGGLQLLTPSLHLAVSPTWSKLLAAVSAAAASMDEEADHGEHEDEVHVSPDFGQTPSLFTTLTAASPPSASASLDIAAALQQAMVLNNVPTASSNDKCSNLLLGAGSMEYPSEGSCTTAARTRYGPYGRYSFTAASGSASLGQLLESSFMTGAQSCSSLDMGLLAGSELGSSPRMRTTYDGKSQAEGAGMQPSLLQYAEMVAGGRL